MQTTTLSSAMRPAHPAAPGSAHAPGMGAPRGPAMAQGSWLKREQVIMGAVVQVQLWADDRPRGEAAIAAVLAELHRINRLLSTARVDSELSRANAMAAAGPVRLGEELFRLLSRSVALATLTRGAFDIVAGSPGGDAADAPWSLLQLDPIERTLRFARPGVQLDLGRAARGHAVDACGVVLARHGIRHACVAVGGHARVVGHRRGMPWVLGLRDKRLGETPLALLPLQDLALCAEGDGTQAFEHEGLRRPLQPEPWPGVGPDTGLAPWRMATVMANDGLAADALARALRVHGIDAGLRLVGRVPDAEALVVDAEGLLLATPALTRRLGGPA
ncbi:FAD:protein FMN transferase [Ideonella sp. A 288]|uniref:FAD:protein FMN transferase n=1 Tax=Ideonella sp. A 288 TaxID=1962181 RepID=UPI001303A157|nr:FAD:protein FMN transferase [Ideonella sp. A 288]